MTATATAGRLLASEARRARYRFLRPVVGCAAAGIAVIAGGTFVAHARDPLDSGDLPQTVAVGVAPLVVAALVLGAAALGTDQSTRALTTLLLYEPRRRRLLAARAGVCALAAAGLTTAVLAVLTLALLPSFDGGAVDAALAALVVRAGLLAAAIAAIGVALAALTRSTVGAVAVTGGYAFLVEQPAAALWPAGSYWLPLTAAVSWVTGEGPHSPAASGAVLAALAVVILVAADVVFRRQDIA